MIHFVPNLQHYKCANNYLNRGLVSDYMIHDYVRVINFLLLLRLISSTKLLQK